MSYYINIHKDMGVHNLYKSITPDVVNVTVKQLHKHGIARIAIDMSAIIHQYYKGRGVVSSDVHGNYTNHIIGIVNLVSTLYCSKVTKVIGVFDNPIKNKWKSGECERRKLIRDNVENKINKCADTQNITATMCKQLFRITKDIIDDAKRTLIYMGVDWVVAPVDYEAEHYAAYLQRCGVVDGIITHDSDTVVYGGTILRKQPGKYRYDIYRTSSILQTHGITHDELIDACIYMGNDFTVGVKGVGFKTYMKSKHKLTLSDDQKKIKDYMMSKPCESKDAASGVFNYDLLKYWVHTGRGIIIPSVNKSMLDMHILGFKNTPFSSQCIDGIKWINDVIGNGDDHQCSIIGKVVDDREDVLSELSELSD